MRHARAAVVVWVALHDPHDQPVRPCASDLAGEPRSREAEIEGAMAAADQRAAACDGVAVGDLDVELLLRLEAVAAIRGVAMRRW